MVAVGLIIFTSAIVSQDWSAEEYQTNTHELNDAFNSIFIDTDTADIKLVRSDDGKCRIVCFESEKAKHSVSVKDSKLIITDRKWYEFIGIFTKSPDITVYLPNAEYNSLTIKNDTGDVKIREEFKFEAVSITSSTGDISLKNTTAKSIELSVSTGKIEIANLNCKSLTSKGSMGDISLNNVIAAEILSVNRSTGDVKLEKCDAGEISIKTATGDVEGTLLTEKTFVTKSSTGDINVPKNAKGGKCEITTSTGDIKITIEP